MCLLLMDVGGQEKAIEEGSEHLGNWIENFFLWSRCCFCWIEEWRRNIEELSWPEEWQIKGLQPFCMRLGRRGRESHPVNSLSIKGHHKADPLRFYVFIDGISSNWFSSLCGEVSQGLPTTSVNRRVRGHDDHWIDRNPYRSSFNWTRSCQCNKSILYIERSIVHFPSPTEAT